MKILAVASSGGHLAQLRSLRPFWDGAEREWVTFETDDATSQLVDERTTWAHFPTTRSVKNTLLNGREAVRVLRRFRPDIVVSTGAGVAVPFFIVAKAMGIHTCFLEVLDRVDSRTLTGRLCYPLADLFCVQWESQLALYPGAHVIGPAL